MATMTASAPVERSPSLMNVVFSLKMYLAAMLAYFIALNMDLQRPFWAVGTVFLVSNPLSGASTSRAVYRIIGTIIGGAMCVALVPNLVNSPEVLTFALASWCAFCLFVSLLDRTPRSYAFMLSGYTAAITGIAMVEQPLSSFDYAVARVEEICIGVICAALVNRIVFPRHAGPVLAQRVNGWLGNAGALVAESLTGQADPKKLAADRRRLAADAVDMRQFTTHIAYDTSHHKFLIRLSRALQQKMIMLLPVLSALEDQRRALLAAQDPERNARMDAILREVADWVGAGPQADPAGAVALRARFDAVARMHAGAEDWFDLLTLNFIRRLRQLLSVWEDCNVLRSAIAGHETDEVRVRSLLAQSRDVRVHRDYGMAAVAALCTFLSVVLANVLWIGSGWLNGTYGAQLAGVFTCILAFIDDPVPELRKFLKFMMVAMVAGFVYDFAILRFVDGFWWLAAALGLYMIPVGTLMGVPRLFAVGLTLSVNFPFMAMLQSSLNVSVVTVLDSNIATVLAMVLAIVMTRMIRSIGAEASARRLLHRGWAQVAANASGRRDLAPEAFAQEMLDILGLCAPRMAASPHAADISSADLVLDSRVGMNVARIKEYLPALPPERAKAARAVLAEVARYYEGRARGADVAQAVARVDAALAEGTGPAPDQAERGLRTALAGIRLGLLPHAPPPQGTDLLRSFPVPVPVPSGPPSSSPPPSSPSESA